MTKFYVASKSKHGPTWLKYREAGVEITARWIDKWDGGRFSPEQQTQHWDDIAEDIRACDALVLYAEKGEIQKGSLAEWGQAFVLGKALYYVGPVDEKTFTGFDHVRVHHSANLDEVFQMEMKR